MLMLMRMGVGGGGQVLSCLSCVSEPKFRMMGGSEREALFSLVLTGAADPSSTVRTAACRCLAVFRCVLISLTPLTRFSSHFISLY